jgi:uncharacterized protein YdhG (YjbR/CyaY superfamily)
MTTDAWIAAQPEPQRSGLAAAAAAVRALLPAATEGTAYGLPAWQVDGTSVAGLACARAHWSFVPFSGAVTEALADRLAAYETTKGSIKVPADATLPKGLITTVVRARLAEISMTPDHKGLTRDFHRTGALKAKGRMKDGELHGSWSWWRADGTLLRTGSFDRGRQVGAWTTYDAAGGPVRTTDKGR